MNNIDLQELIEHGIINPEKLLSQLEMAKAKKILENHKFPIWQSSTDGRWYTYLPDETDKNHRKMKKRTKKEDLEKDIIDYYKAHEFNPTVNEVFEMWIKNKSKNVLSQTILRYESVFNAHIKPTWFGNMKMKNVSFKHLDKFCSETIGKDKMKAKCWAGIRTDLIGIIRTAKKEGLNNLSITDLKDLDISKNAFKTEVILPGTDVITNDEAQKLLEYIDNHSDDIELLGIRLMFMTGLRIGELSTLKYSDFNFEKGVLTVTRTEEKIANPDPSAKTKTAIAVRERTKGARGWREIIINDSAANLVKMIRSFNPDGKWLFEVDGERIKANAWTKRLPRLCAKLGIGEKAVKVVNGKEVIQNYSLDKSTHKVRKNYCSTLLHAGIEPKFVQIQMGHTDLQTTLSYYDRDTEEFDVRKAALLPVLDKM